jgi:phosphoglycerate dehydrogenase-like enzyme
VKIYVDLGLQEDEAAQLARITAHDEVWIAHGTPSTESDRQAFLNAEVVLGRFPTDLLAEARPLRWIQFSSVGIDAYLHLDWAPLKGQVICTNLAGVFAEAMAQSVLGGILAINRGLDQLVTLQVRSDWQKSYLHPRIRILRRAHVLLLGNGSVGTRLRELLTPFGCTFTIYARTSGDIHTAAELDAALPRADIVCAALPDTAATRGLVNAARIQRFKPDALFVNVGRGSLVDEAALIAALRENRLRGAILDVTQREPLPPDDPLWDSPRTLLTQHTSAGSDREIHDTITFFGQNLERYRAGEPLRNVIDWRKGY